MSDPVQSHRQQCTSLPRPWDSPGKNNGMGCHYLLQCMKVKSESEVAQMCPTLSDPIDCSLPDSSVHGIFQARVLEWVAIASPCGKFWIYIILKTWLLLFTQLPIFLRVFLLWCKWNHHRPLWLGLNLAAYNAKSKLKRL